VPNPKDDNAFGQGTKEDDTRVTVVTGSIPPNKNDLTALYVTGLGGTTPATAGHTFIYIAWTRAANIGSANLDIELNQVAFTLPSTPQKDLPLSRTAGDLLVLYDFGGSGTPALSLATWITSGSCAVGSDSPPCWGPLGTVSTSASEAAVRSDGLLGEAVIDLTAAGLVAAGQCESFAQGWDKARASTSLNAELKDFLAPGPAHVNTCGALKVTKQSTKGNSPLAGAAFQIKDSNGTLVATLTTDSSGTACKGGLTQGTYTVLETQAPNGYRIDNPGPVSVSVDHTASCADSPNTAAVFTDTPLSQIQVRFTSLAGAGVTNASIVCVNGGTIAAVSENGNADPALDDTEETFTNLVPGTYTCTVVVDP
jgi:uncharacterized surface anchored protein